MDLHLPPRPAAEEKLDPGCNLQSGQGALLHREIILLGYIAVGFRRPAVIFLGMPIQIQAYFAFFWLSA